MWLTLFFTNNYQTNKQTVDGGWVVSLRSRWGKMANLCNDESDTNSGSSKESVVILLSREESVVESGIDKESIGCLGNTRQHSRHYC